MNVLCKEKECLENIQKHIKMNSRKINIFPLFERASCEFYIIEVTDLDKKNRMIARRQRVSGICNFYSDQYKELGISEEDYLATVQKYDAILDDNSYMFRTKEDCLNCIKDLYRKAFCSRNKHNAREL